MEELIKQVYRLGARNDDDDDDDDSGSGGEEVRPSKKARMSKDEVEQVLALPQLVILEIFGKLGPEDLRRLCGTSKMFAQVVCAEGEPPLDENGRLPDRINGKAIIFELWKNLLLRDFGISYSQNECAAHMQIARRMAAESLVRHIDINDASKSRWEKAATLRALYYRLVMIVKTKERFAGTSGVVAIAYRDGIVFFDSPVPALFGASVTAPGNTVRGYAALTEFLLPPVGTANQKVEKCVFTEVPPDLPRFVDDYSNVGFFCQKLESAGTWMCLTNEPSHPLKILSNPGRQLGTLRGVTIDEAGTGAWCIYRGGRSFVDLSGPAALVDIGQTEKIVEVYQQRDRKFLVLTPVACVFLDRTPDYLFALKFELHEGISPPSVPGVRHTFQARACAFHYDWKERKTRAVAVLDGTDTMNREYIVHELLYTTRESGNGWFEPKTSMIALNSRPPENSKTLVVATARTWGFFKTPAGSDLNWPLIFVRKPKTSKEDGSLIRTLDRRVIFFDSSLEDFSRLEMKDIYKSTVARLVRRHLTNVSGRGQV